MAWQNDPLVLYHGTVTPFANDISQRKRPDLTKARARSDFSVGFYTTRVRKQAEDFANKKYHRMLRLCQQNSMNLDPRSAAVVELLIDRNRLGRLDTLAFVFGEVDWHDFVTYCRTGIRGHRGPGSYYDVVYGPVATIRENGGSMSN